MSSPRKPVSPVKPSGMELVFFYGCPYCGNEQPALAPLHPGMLSCDKCRQNYPVVPIDEHTVHFVRIILSGGAAAIDSDYM